MAIDREKVLQAAQKLVEKKKYDKAVLEYQKLIAEDPNDARTLLKIGDLQAKMEAYPDAISTYEKVGKHYAQQGFALKAIAVYKQIRELIAKHSPQLEERYGHIAPKLADLYQQLGLTSDALAALDEVATRLQRQQKDQEAIDVFRKIVDLDPSNPLPHLRLAEALSRIKDMDGAVAEFGLAASQLVRLGRRDDALKVIERLLHHKQDAAHARIAAELYLARGGANDGMQALAKLQICFQSNPKDLDTLALLARAFSAIGQGTKGVEVQKEMARIAREQGKRDLFKQLVEKLERVAPNDEGVRQLVGMARADATAPPPAVTTNVSTQTRDVPPPPPRRNAPPPPPPSRAVEEVEDLSDDVLETSDLVEDLDDEAAPFPLRSEPPAHSAPDRTYRDRAQAPPPAPAPPSPARRESSAPELLVGDEHVEAIESYVPDMADTNEQLAQALADAASYRRVRLYPKAIETLHAGLDIEPRSLDLREFLRDVLLEAGRVVEAVDEMLTLATLYVDSLDGEAAARALQDVLAYDPQNARARAMLAELGYEVIDEPQPGEHPAYDMYADEAPLPSYDLDELGPGEAAPGYPDSAMQPGARSTTNRPFGQSPFDVVEDPFAADAPLPSFPLEPAPESEAAYGLHGGHEEADPFPAGEYGEEPKTAQTELATAPPPAPSSPSYGRPAPELEEALDEAEFFVSRGLYDDARNILREQLSRLPNNPLVRERLHELDSQEHVARGSGTREMPREAAAGRAPSAPPPGVGGVVGGLAAARGRPVTSAPPAALDDDRAFDIAASLDALEASDHAAQNGASFAAPGEQIDVEEVFAKFKEGVAKQISVDDAQSHYDLGVAYKEMGLVDDAVREFETAARDPKRECICRSMIGMIQLERGNLNEAIDAFMRGLNARARTPEQETVLCFEIGNAYESKKVTAKALEFYQRVLRRDPDFRDVQERIRRLSKAEQKNPIRAAAVGDEEFDRAFDEILGSGKGP